MSDQFDERQVEAVARALETVAHINDRDVWGRTALSALNLPAIIHAAKLEGAAMMRDAAAKKADAEWWGGNRHRTASILGPEIVAGIRILDPATIIAKEKP